MDAQQLIDVVEKIEFHKKRPRALEEWFCYRKNLFLEVWRIIFPKERFPHFIEPVAPCRFSARQHALESAYVR